MEASGGFADHCERAWRPWLGSFDALREYCLASQRYEPECDGCYECGRLGWEPRWREGVRRAIARQGRHARTVRRLLKEAMGGSSGPFVIDGWPEDDLSEALTEAGIMTVATFPTCPPSYDQPASTSGPR